MNAKKAKALRKFIRQVAEESDQKRSEVQYIENTKRRKFVDVEKVSGDGKSTYTSKELVSKGTISLDMNTLKGSYREVKKRVRNVK